MRTSILVATCLAVLAAAAPQDADPNTTTTTTSTPTTSTTTTITTFTPTYPEKAYCTGALLPAKVRSGYHCNAKGALASPSVIAYGVAKSDFSDNVNVNCWLSCTQLDSGMCYSFAADAAAGTCVLYGKTITDMGYKRGKSSALLSNYHCYYVGCQK